MKKIYWLIAEFFEAVAIKCDEVSIYFRAKGRGQTELTEENFDEVYEDGNY